MCSRAGHPSPVLVTESSCDFLDVDFGLPLGSLPWDYRVGTVALTPGDCLVLFTDGVTEARSGKELYDEERVLDALGQVDALDAQRVAERLKDDVSADACRLKDDLQILTFRLTRD
jgi:serine phosphatase RsbU (regulator of sigma subunit)